MEETDNVCAQNEMNNTCDMYMCRNGKGEIIGQQITEIEANK